ncbi:hypothetical protein O9993_22790 [Vibrio lentus]|nr:hypothetical protein [Vibrio lentus]
MVKHDLAMDYWLRNTAKTWWMHRNGRSNKQPKTHPTNAILSFRIMVVRLMFAIIGLSF